MIPYHVDVPMSRWPVANFGLIVVITLVSVSVWGGGIDRSTAIEMILNGWDLNGLIGHMLLHAGGMHLFGNMLFLWVFGNAVCAKVGNMFYPLLFMILGLFSAAAFNIFDGGPAVGASGAINGIVGMFLVLYPRNNISCFFIIVIRPVTFSVSSFWMILYWLAFDLWGVMMGGGGIGYSAHLGGFAAGVIIAVLLIKTGLVKMADDEESLLDVMGIGV